MKGEQSFGVDEKFLEKILQKNESDPNLEVVSIDSTAACKAGDNYMSDARRYTVLAKDCNNNLKKRCLLIKKQLANHAWREAYGCEMAFQNEADAYQKVIPEMNKFRCDEKLAFPKCYYAAVDCTVLEDLKPLGYTMADRREGLDFSHAKLAMKELGRFHGTSLAMKHSEPEAFERAKSGIRELVFLPEKKNGIEGAIINALRTAAIGLKIFRAAGTNWMEDPISKLERLRCSTFEKLIQLASPKEPLSVICHGDFYTNNLMFKYNSEEVSEIMIVDLQCFRYASLSLDLLYFLNSSLSPGVLSTHFYELIEVYQTSLNLEIENYSPSAPQVSLREIYNELESHSTFGLVMGLLVLPAVTAAPGTSFLNEEEESYNPEDYFERGIDLLSPDYFRRLKQVIKDNINLGYLEKISTH